jgi:hypothetical protein
VVSDDRRGESSSDLGGLRDLQRFADGQGLLPGQSCLLVMIDCMQGIAQVSQRLGLPVLIA